MRKGQKKADQKKCILFHCNRLSSWKCCHYCERKEICTDPCLNDPARCGAMDAGEGMPDDLRKEYIRRGWKLHEHHRTGRKSH